MPAAGGQAATFAQSQVRLLSWSLTKSGSSDPIGAGTGPENRGARQRAWQVRLLRLPNERQEDEGRRMNQGVICHVLFILHPSSFFIATVAQSAGGAGLRNRTVLVRIPRVALGD